VNGVPRKVMTYDWLWPILVSIAATAFIVFGYTKRSGRPRMLELAFASAMLIIWATLFLLHET